MNRRHDAKQHVVRIVQRLTRLRHGIRAHRPMLIAEDGSVHAMRRWFAAFHSASPPPSRQHVDDGAGQDPV